MLKLITILFLELKNLILQIILKSGLIYKSIHFFFLKLNLTLTLINP